MGCQDKQTSAGTGKGGGFSRALSLCIERMMTTTGCNFNVSRIYNETLKMYQETNPPGHEQNISIHGAKLRPHEFPWPLQPKGQYKSPFTTINRVAVREMNIMQYGAPTPQM